MKNMARPLENPRKGNLLFMDNGQSWNPEYSLWQIADVGDDRIEIQNVDTGATDSIKIAGLSNGKLYPVWTNSVPRLPVGELIALVSLLETSRYTNHAFAFETGKPTKNGDIPLKPIGFEMEEEDADIFLGHEFVAEQSRRDAIMFEEDIPTPVVAPGQVIVLRPNAVRDDSISRIVIVKGEIATPSLSVGDARYFASKTVGPFDSPAWPIGDEESFDREIGACMAAHEEDEIIVLSIDGGTLNRPDTVLKVISHAGRKLYWSDCLEDDLYGTSLSAGIWRGSGIQWHDNGDDGAEWSAAWERLTIQDMIDREITLEEVRDEFNEYAERDMIYGDIEDIFGKTYDGLDLVSTKDDGISRALKMAADWIEAIRSQNYNPDEKTIIASDTDRGGRVIVMAQLGQPLASITVMPVSNDTILVTRLIDEDLKETMLAQDVKRWQDMKTS